MTEPQPTPLAELHVHFQGCILPSDLLRHLASCDQIDWNWYEGDMRAAYGSVPPVHDLVERYRQGDTSVVETFEEIAVIGDADAGNFKRFQAKGSLFWIGVHNGDDTTLRMKEASDFAAGIRAELARESVDYIELRRSDWTGPALVPQRHLMRNFDDASDGPVQRIAASLRRADPWPEWEQIKELALGPHGEVLTGIDFCGVEEGYPPTDKAEFFADVHTFNVDHPDRALAILYHVGESFTDKSLESAIRWVQETAELGAHRLGHAIALGVDPRAFGTHTRTETVSERRDQIAYDLKHRSGLEKAGVQVDTQSLLAEQSRLHSLPEDHTISVTYDEARLEDVHRRQNYAIGCVKATDAVIEVCQTSNRRIANIIDPAHHPVHRFLENGVRFVVCSDDPGMFGVTLDDELDWVCAQTGGGNDLRNHLIETAWASRSERMSGRTSAQR